MTYSLDQYLSPSILESSSVHTSGWCGSDHLMSCDMTENLTTTRLESWATISAQRLREGTSPIDYFLTMARLPIRVVGSACDPLLPLLGHGLGVGGKGEPLLPWRFLMQFSPAHRYWTLWMQSSWVLRSRAWIYPTCSQVYEVGAGLRSVVRAGHLLSQAVFLWSANPFCRLYTHSSQHFGAPL